MAARLHIHLRLVVIVLCLFCSSVSSKKPRMPLLEKAISDVVIIYNKFAKVEGHPDTLNSREFTALIKENAPRCMVGLDVFASIDEDQDGELNLKEYLNYVLQYLQIRGNNHFEV